MRTLAENRFKLNLPSKVVQRGYRLLQLACPPAVAGPYHLTMSNRHKFVWFRVAKVGTRTIFNHFKEQDVDLTAVEPSFVRYPPLLYSNYFKFAFVRNPWDRLVSCWHNKILNKNYFDLSEQQRDGLRNFENFVSYVQETDLLHRDRHTQPQVELINLDDVDFLGRMESFGKDFRHVCERIGVPAGELGRLNASEGRDSYRTYYSPKLRDRVGTMYERDISTFGYDF